MNRGSINDIGDFQMVPEEDVEEEYGYNDDYGVEYGTESHPDSYRTDNETSVPSIATHHQEDDDILIPAETFTSPRTRYQEEQLQDLQRRPSYHPTDRYRPVEYYSAAPMDFGRNRREQSENPQDDVHYTSSEQMGEEYGTENYPDTVQSEVYEVREEPGRLSFSEVLDKPLDDSQVPDTLSQIFHRYKGEFENIIVRQSRQSDTRRNILAVAATYNYFYECVYPQKINDQSTRAVNSFVNEVQQLYQM